MVIYISNLSIRWTETGVPLGVQGQPELHTKKFQASLGIHFKTVSEKQNKQTNNVSQKCQVSPLMEMG